MTRWIQTGPRIKQSYETLDFRKKKHYHLFETKQKDPVSELKGNQRNSKLNLVTFEVSLLLH